MASGLYGGPHGVTHCGCYHEERGKITADTDDFWLVYEYDDHNGMRLRQNAEVSRATKNNQAIKPHE